MPAYTAHLNLYLPGGGKDGLGGDDEPVDIDKLNQNFQKIDDWSEDTDTRLTLATNAEVAAGTDTTKLVTPASLQGKAATNAEIDAATSTTKFITPAGMKRGSPYLGNASKTSGSTTTNSGTEVAISGISLAVTVPRAGRVRLIASMTTFSSQLDDVLLVRIKDGSTVVADFTTRPNSSNSTASTSMYQYLSIVLPSVSAGSHTYTLAIARAAGSGTITVTSSALNPVQLTAEMMD